MSRGDAERNRNRRRIAAMFELVAGEPPRHDHRAGVERCATCGRHERDAAGHHDPSFCARCRALAAAVREAVSQ